MKRNPFPFLELKNELPRLPIPQLSDTLSRYLLQVRPLLTDEEFNKTKANVELFQTEEGGGPQLHRELLNLDSEAETSWLEGFWDTMYLEYRDPAPINTNPSFIFHETPDMTQIGRAADFIHSTSRFIKLLQSNKIEIDKERGKPLCMSQYWKFFGSCRQPRYVRDEILTFPFSEHIVVMFRNHFFQLNVFHNGEIVSLSSLKFQLEKILTSSPELFSTSQGEREGGVGIFTSDNRDIWTEARSNLINYSSNNKKNLEIIDSALFLLCLDEISPKSTNELSKIMLHGETGENRWFDKLLLIVLSDGNAAWNMEHAPYDGHTLLIISTYIFDDIIEKSTLNSSSPSSSSSPFSSLSSDVSLPISYSPLHLKWNLNENLLRKIEISKRNIGKFIRETDTNVVLFNEFGSKQLSKEVLVSPDAFVQMSYQLTYFLLKNKVASTYESANTKGFYHGRTETIRSLSSQSKLFTERFVNSIQKNNFQNERKELAQLLRDALNQHVKTAQLAKKGEGVDRHLYGLLWLAKQRRQRLANYEIPAIFTDNSYPKFTGSILSTSNCGGKALDLFSFGPVMAEGFGLGYIIKENSIHVNVTNFCGESFAFAALLKRCFNDLFSLLLWEVSQKKLQSSL